MNEDGTYNLNELEFSATAKCRCGAGLAYATETDAKAWICSDWLLGKAPIEDNCISRDQFIPLTELEEKAKHDAYPFWCYEINSEQQPSANGRTPRRLPEQQVTDHAFTLKPRKGASDKSVYGRRHREWRTRYRFCGTCGCHENVHAQHE